MPIPERNGSLEELNAFLNIKGEDLSLVKAWLLASLKPNIQYPVLVLQGEQGCAKSTACEVLCEIVDPNVSNLKGVVKDERDLAIAASNRLIVCLDNLSGIKNWLSDALCRIATGGGYSTRQLYSDDDEKIFTLRNPILLNGIDEIATRSDLLDRSIVLNLSVIETRKPASDLWKKFNTVKPRIIGALLDALSEGLRNIENVQLEDYPRMADFTKLATAAEKSLGINQGDFVNFYNRNRNNANNLVLEYSLLAPVVIDFVAHKREWTGIAKDIKDVLDRTTDELTKRSRFYPQSSIKVANDLRRIAPNLRMAGIDIKFAGDEGQSRESGTGNRTITITNLNLESSQSSQSSQEVLEDMGLLF